MNGLQFGLFFSQSLSGTRRSHGEPRRFFTPCWISGWDADAIIILVTPLRARLQCGWGYNDKLELYRIAYFAKSSLPATPHLPLFSFFFGGGEGWASRLTRRAPPPPPPPAKKQKITTNNNNRVSCYDLRSSCFKFGKLILGSSGAILVCLSHPPVRFSPYKDVFPQ